MSGTTGSYPPIVLVNVSQQVGPVPNTLQRRGAIISQGATTLAAGAYQLISGTTALTPYLSGSAAISNMTWAAGLVTVTTATPHGIPVGDTVFVTIAGAVPTGWNGTFSCTATSTTVFTHNLAANPGTPTTEGTFTLDDVSELTSAVQTFFAQGSANQVYVLELGTGQASDGITALNTFIQANQGFFYSYLLPHSWGVASTLGTGLLANYTNTTARTYFHVTTTLTYWQANPTFFKPTYKCAIVTIEAPTVAASAATGVFTEFSAAAGFYATLNLNPSSTNKVTQAAYSFLFGVTPYPTAGNTTLFTQLNAAGLNWIGTGAEGGISNLVWMYGQTLDGNDFNKYWYAVDNVELNLDTYTAAAVINGANNPLAPLDYNQQGINTLQGVAVSIMKMELSFNLALGSIVSVQLDPNTFAENLQNGVYSGQIAINAVPFATYVQANPSDYTDMVYKGLQVAFTVQNGFRQVVYNVTVSNFVS